jgi:UDP-N-acetylglucosamine:LPS N-acetylglucosamine transferase
VPTLMIPNTSTSTDDQERRAALAAKDGLALDAHPDEPDDIVRAIESLFDPDVRHAITARCRQAFPGNGAAEAMERIERLALRGRQR